MPQFAANLSFLFQEVDLLGACPKKLRVSHQELPLGR
jgi:hydroxypyruvate isomerase